MERKKVREVAKKLVKERLGLKKLESMYKESLDDIVDSE